MDREPTRAARERAFHDQRYRMPTARKERVGRFYGVAGSVRDAYWSRVLELAPDQDVLEIGCGTGARAIALAERGARVTGVDISPVAVRKARRRAERRGVADRVAFRRMNAATIGDTDERFDLVCATGVLHHVPLGRALPGIARVLRPDGRALFVEPLGHNPAINLYRRRTPSIRTADERPLTASDIASFGEHFATVEARYFCLTSLLAALPGLGFLLGALERLDRRLLAVRALQRYAWQVVVELRDPVTSAAAAPSAAAT
jgi:SAM-dependent methyltransferase